MLEANDITDPKLVVNRIRLDMVKSGNMLNVEDMLDILRIDLLGIVPDDQNIVISTNKGEPVINYENSLAAKAYKNIARRITGEKVEFLNMEEQKSFLDKVKSFFSK